MRLAAQRRGHGRGPRVHLRLVQVRAAGARGPPVSVCVCVVLALPSGLLGALRDTCWVKEGRYGLVAEVTGGITAAASSHTGTFLLTVPAMCHNRESVP